MRGIEFGIRLAPDRDAKSGLVDSRAMGYGIT